MEENLEKWCEDIRSTIRDTGNYVRALMDHNYFQDKEQFKGQYGEMKANIMLSYRHLEDARMRLGKVMQQIRSRV